MLYSVIFNDLRCELTLQKTRFQLLLAHHWLTASIPRKSATIVPPCDAIRYKIATQHQAPLGSSRLIILFAIIDFLLLHTLLAKLPTTHSLYATIRAQDEPQAALATE